MLLNYKLTIKIIFKTALFLISAVVICMSGLVYVVPIDSNVSVFRSVSFDDTVSSYLDQLTSSINLVGGENLSSTNPVPLPSN